MDAKADVDREIRKEEDWRVLHTYYFYLLLLDVRKEKRERE